MKKCKFCTAEMQDEEIKCNYCGKEESEEIVENKDDNEKEEKDLDEKKQSNPNSEVHQEIIPKKKNKVVYILLLITVALSIGACFLPYVKVDNYSINYVYNSNIASLSKSDGIKDGIFVVIFGIVTILTLLIGKKRIPAIVCQVLSIGVFFMDYIDANKDMQVTLVKEYYGEFYGIGFYLVIIFLIVSLILSIIRLIKKNELT
jgi:hypothetical protein